MAFVAGVPGETFTSSSGEFDTIITTPVTMTVNNWSLELKARMQGRPILYDQFFSVPFADPLFQAGIVSAQGVLTGAGAAAFLGPALLSNSQSLVNSSTNTIQTGTLTTQTLLDSAVYVGPYTIPAVGNLGVCQAYTLAPAGPNANASGLVNGFGGNYALPTGCSGGFPYPILFGGIDVDAMTFSLVNALKTATTTHKYLNTQVYEVDGLTSSAVPEPASVALVLMGLAGLWWARRLD